MMDKNYIQDLFDNFDPVPIKTYKIYIKVDGIIKVVTYKTDKNYIDLEFLKNKITKQEKTPIKIIGVYV